MSERQESVHKRTHVRRVEICRRVAAASHAGAAHLASGGARLGSAAPLTASLSRPCSRAARRRPWVARRRT
eukprot:2976816-Prymnesium_polylepis.1